MREYHIINPAAGQGAAPAKARAAASDRAILYETAGVGDARRYLAKTLSGISEDVRVYVWGGDGTIGEAVGGIMDAGAQEHAILTACPAGTGNDFIRMFEDGASDEEYRLDIFAVDGGSGVRDYVLNMINIGFDCAVADSMAAWKKKPLIRGSLAYICAVAEVLFRPMGTEMTVKWTDPDGNVHTKSGKFLLCAAANGQYCGGGFRGAPTASLMDGTAELLIVDLISRRRFIGLVGMYRAGTHVDANGVPVPKIADVLHYIKCTSAEISGMEIVCQDGEIHRSDRLQFSVLPGAIRYRTIG